MIYVYIVLLALMLSPAFAFWGRSSSSVPFLDNNFAAEAFANHLATCGLGDKSEWIKEATRLCEAALLLLKKAERSKDVAALRHFLDHLDEVWEDKGPKNVVEKQRAEVIATELKVRTDRLGLNDKKMKEVEAARALRWGRVYHEMEKQFPGEWKQFLVLGKERGDFSVEDWKEARMNDEAPSTSKKYKEALELFEANLRKAGTPEGISFEEAFSDTLGATVPLYCPIHDVEEVKRHYEAMWKKEVEKKRKEVEKKQKKTAEDMHFAPILHRRNRNRRRIFHIAFAWLAAFRLTPADRNESRQFMGGIFLPRTYLHFYEQSGVSTWPSVAIPLITDFAALLWNLALFVWLMSTHDSGVEIFFGMLGSIVGWQLLSLIFLVVLGLFDTESGLETAYLMIVTKLALQSFLIYKIYRFRRKSKSA